MAIPLTDQSTAAVDPAFRMRVQAAHFKRAATAFDDTANANATIQLKRLLLVQRILLEPTAYLDQFCWWVVTRDGLTSVADLADDSQIYANITTTGFDKIASMVISDAEVGA